MTPNQKILHRAFLALTPAQQARLREHAERKTPICCGERAKLFYQDGAG